MSDNNNEDADNSENLPPVNRRRVLGDDYAGGDVLSDFAVRGRIDYFAKRIERLNILRYVAMTVCIAVVICLLVALGLMIDSFTKQIDQITPSVNNLLSKTAPVAVNSETTPTTTTATSIKKADEQKDGSGSAVTRTVDAVSATTTISVDMSSIGGSIVAVITVLVLAVSALAIVLLRTTYALTTGDSYDGKSESKSEPDDIGIPLPGAEIIKAVGEALADALKSVSKKD